LKLTLLVPFKVNPFNIVNSGLKNLNANDDGIQEIKIKIWWYLREAINSNGIKGTGISLDVIEWIFLNNGYWVFLDLLQQLPTKGLFGLRWFEGDWRGFNLSYSNLYPILYRRGFNLLQYLAIHL
jgi:hypothetical protein